MPEPTAEKASRSDKRELVLRAALDLFAEKGFHGTAVPEVATRAGVGAGTIYRYFDGKETLVNVLFRRHKAALAEAIVGGFPWDAAPREQFRELWKRVSAWALRNPTAVRFLELHHHGDYLDDESRALKDRVFGIAEQFARSASEAGAIKDYPVGVLTSLGWGAFVGMIKGSWEGHLDLTPESIAQAERCCWDLIRR